jgi:hypothetical protein
MVNMCGLDEPHPYLVSFTYRTEQARADEVQENDRVHFVSWHESRPLVTRYLLPQRVALPVTFP